RAFRTTGLAPPAASFPGAGRACRGRWGARSLEGLRGRRRAFLAGVDARWQRNTVKASYLRSRGRASCAAHGTDVTREGAQSEGGKRRGFSAEHQGIDLTPTLRGMVPLSARA